MDGTTILSRPSGEIIAKTDYQWSVESIKTAFKTLAKTNLIFFLKEVMVINYIRKCKINGYYSVPLGNRHP